MVLYGALLISCAIAVFFYGPTTGIAGFINRTSLDWSRLRSRKHPVTEAIRINTRIVFLDASRDAQPWSPSFPQSHFMCNKYNIYLCL